MALNYLTSKNLCIFFLAGIILYPIGINQSFAQSPVLAVGDTLDLSGYDAIEATCLESFRINRLQAQSIDLFPGRLAQSPAPCFEGNTRTWQNYILNAADDTVVHSTAPITTSTLTGGNADSHRTIFDGLEPDTDYRFILFLTGVYSANPGTDAYAADTSVYRIVSFTTAHAQIAAVGDTLDLSRYDTIEESCLQINQLTPRATSISGPLGALVQSPTPCFEDNTRTYQAYILNADDNTVVNVKTPVATSSSTNRHQIDLSGLEPNTDYRVVLFLTGAYNGGSGPYVDDTTVYRITPFTTPLEIGDTLDLSGYNAIEESCLEGHQLTARSTEIFSSLGTLVQSPAPCFEGNLHTWQNYILNADDNTVVKFKLPVATSSSTDSHFIFLRSLESNTDYRAVWLLTGAYSANPGDLTASPYADTTVYRIVSFTTPAPSIATVGATLDLSRYSTIEESCLEGNRLTFSSTGTSGSLGTLVQFPAPCFEDNLYTWQAYILNAADNTVVKSKTPASTSSLDDRHYIGFSSLESNTDYRIVLILTGAYSADPSASPYVDSTIYRVTSFTTLVEIGDTLDLTRYSTIDESCLDGHLLISRSTTITGPLGRLVQSPAPCFEGNARVWQAFLLNADDIVVQFKNPATISSSTNRHQISFSNLEPNTDYRAVFILTGAYSADPDTSPYVTTSVYRVTPFTTAHAPIAVIGDTLDLTGYDTIDESCLGENQLFIRPTSISGIFGALAPASCFEDNMHTWQAFILNADDDIVVKSKLPVATSDADDTHYIFFSSLEPNTNYRIVLFLTGAYNGGSGPYTDSTIYRVTSFTVLAEDHTIEALQGSSELLTIPFKELLTLPIGHTFDEIIIRISVPSAQFADELDTGFSGTDMSNPDFKIFTRVIADTVTISTRITANDDISFPYTITDRNGLVDSGVITITFVNFIGDVMANPYTSTLDDLFGLPTLDIVIPPNEIIQTLLKGTVLEEFTSLDVAFTTPGTGDHAGTLNIIGTTLQYTPASGFSGTETFQYTISLFGKSGSSEFHFVVPAVTCDTNIDSGVSFGDLDAGETSDASEIMITNEGNADAQIMMKGDAWRSVVSGIHIMNAEVTKYSVTESDTYDTRTSFTVTSANVGEIGDDTLSVYLQLHAELIDDSFRGDAAQELTISAVCS